MMKSKNVFLLLILIGPAFLAGCVQKPLSVGFVGPLTGSSAPIGLGGRNGFLMALGSGPGAAVGKTPELELLVKDDHNDPDACLAALVELKAAGCSIVILGTTSQASTKALPWAMEHDILVISPTISAPIPGSDNTLFVRINLPAAAYGALLADLAYRRLGKTRVAVVGDAINAGYVLPVVEAFTTRYTEQGGTISWQRLFNSRTDAFSAGLAQALREARSDGLLVVAASTETALIAKELQKEDFATQILLPPWPLTMDLLENGGSAVAGSVAVSIADLEFRTPAGKTFQGKYNSEYGEPPSFTALFGYEAAMILRTVLAAKVGREPRKIRDKILELGAYDGLQGPIRFDAQGNAERDLFIFRIENGSYKSME